MYAGDASLRGLREEVPITKAQIEEVIRCKEDIIYFANNHFYIISQDEGLIKIPLRDYQKQILKCYVEPPNGKKSILVMQGRQSGKCVLSSSIIKVRDKSMGEIIETTIPDLISGGNDTIGLGDEKIILTKKLDKYEIYTEQGWKDLTEVHKTKKFEVWELRLETHTLKCADEHIVVLADGLQVYVSDLIVGDDVCVDGGTERVISVVSLGYEDYMYDVSVDSDSHLYYVNGILSHNTTVTTIFITHFALFNKHKNIYLIANKQDTAMEIMYRIQEAYRKLPLWLQQGIKEWSKLHIEFENGSRITAATTAPQSISGQSVGLLYIDELSKVPAHIAEEFMTATLPVISASKTAKIIATSTPLGASGVWHDLWVKAVAPKSSYHRIRVPWYLCYTQEFKEQTIADNGLPYWHQEYECRFLGAKDTLIDADKLELIETRDAIDLKYGGLLKVYEKPKRGSKYVVGVDVATGVGGDYSCMQVLEIVNNKHIVQCAVYRHNKISIHDFTQVCVAVGEYYNKAILVIENNLGGGECADAVWYTYEYENVYNNDVKKIGVRATTRSKMVAVLNMKRYIENGWIEIFDGETVKEITNYGEKKRGTFGALGSKQHDDLVAALYWGLYYLISDDFVGESNDSIAQLNKIDDKYNIEPDEDNSPETSDMPSFQFSDGF